MSPEGQFIKRTAPVTELWRQSLAFRMTVWAAVLISLGGALAALRVRG